jgi:hypothetical protein
MRWRPRSTSRRSSAPGWDGSHREHIVIDTAHRDVEACTADIRRAIAP